MLALAQDEDQGAAISIGEVAMDLGTELDSLQEAGVPSAFRQFGSLLDAEWVDEALEETGTASVRRRKLPAQLVVWLVIAMALFRDSAIHTVVQHLRLVLPGGKKGKAQKGRTVASSAVSESRERLGEEPVRAIFLRTGQAWAEPAAKADSWRGLSLWGVDGTTLNVDDTEDNVKAFGRPGTSRGQSGYPQVRLVALMALRAHLLRAAAFGPCKGKQTGEQALAQQLWGALPDDSLTIMDRNFVNYGLFYRLTHDEHGTQLPRHYLVRAKSNLKWKTLAVLGPGDELIELKISSQARKKDPGLPRRIRARAVRYQIKGYGPRTLLTSLIDPDAFPAEEIARLYHERWETELGYKELKVDMLRRKEALRSRKPDGVRQEIWGIVLAYNLVRRKMLDVADRLDVPPTRISFKNSLLVIPSFCHSYAWVAAPGTLPKGLEQLDEMLSVLLLPERRSERRYPRHVKIKMSGYKRNRGTAS
jgi:hypothetical protein